MKWDIDKEKAEHLLHQEVTVIFSCYVGEKDPNILIEKPEIIEPEDYQYISLSNKEIEISKEIINDLLKILKR